MSWNAKWRGEWDALIGTTTDYGLARRLGVRESTVRLHRLKLGIRPFSGKQKVKCSYCPVTMWRKQIRPVNTCRQCELAKVRAKSKEWYDAHKGERDSGGWWRSHPEERKAYIAAYREKNRKKLRRYFRKYGRDRYKRDKQLIANLPCFDCGQKHTEELRLRILRRMLPCGSREIHDAWMCIWGPAGEKGGAGAQRLRRDLEMLGAISIKRGEYMLARAA